LAKVLPPVLVSFAITRKCNLRCPHCYSDSIQTPHPQELTTEEAKQLIADIAEAGARLIIFDGGEPTMREDLFELIKYARDVGLQPLLGTNATLITKDYARKLKEAGLRAAAVSLDGARSETHDAFRGVSGTWRETIEGIKNLAKAGIPFQIAPCLTKYNWKELPQIIEIAKRYGAFAVEVFDYVTSGRGRQFPDYELDIGSRKEIIDLLIDMQRKEEELFFKVIAMPQYWVMVEKKVPEEEILLKFVRTCCGAGIRYACILYEGTVYPCMVLQVRLGNIRETSFKKIWYESPVLDKLRNRDLLKGKCGLCQYKYVCGGARCKAYEKTGDYLASDPTCWIPLERAS
jgi:radical SAM protein with 4Fe4S-binding SPASM domain